MGHNALSLCLWHVQIQYFTPHSEACQVAARCGLDAKAVVEDVLRCRYSKRLRVTRGLLAGIHKPVQLLTAAEEAFQDTESAYLNDLVGHSSLLKGQLRAGGVGDVHEHMETVCKPVLILCLPRMINSLI